MSRAKRTLSKSLHSSLGRPRLANAPSPVVSARPARPRRTRLPMAEVIPLCSQSDQSSSRCGSPERVTCVYTPQQNTVFPSAVSERLAATTIKRGRGPSSVRSSDRVPSVCGAPSRNSLTHSSTQRTTEWWWWWGPDGPTRRRSRELEAASSLGGWGGTRRCVRRGSLFFHFLLLATPNVPNAPSESAALMNNSRCRCPRLALRLPADPWPRPTPCERAPMLD